MSTCKQNSAARPALGYVIAAIVCAGVGAGYEQFSHGVYSGFMLYAFGFPLVLGALPFGFLAARGNKAPRAGSRTLYACGVATLTAGSFLRGVMDIYGTVSRLIPVYFWAGAALLAAAVLAEVTLRAPEDRPS